MTGVLIAGCAHRPAPEPEAAIAPNPFGYLKRSAVCTVAPVVAGPAGRSTTMAVRSDDGLCTVAVSQPDGTAYASFLLQTLPVNGKAFIYNYNNQTLVNYTATTAYSGPDSFTVSLIPTAGGRRQSLQVTAMVDATGVPRPAPAVVPYVAPPSAGTHKAAAKKKPKHHTSGSSAS
ncbi:hypothetical protein [Lichenicola sp.]|uniref:hypothetical protein n=1 Tax=Lichenicola sp. TaxID=2804529 RepID=UPI003B00978E